MPALDSRSVIGTRSVFARVSRFFLLAIFTAWALIIASFLWFVWLVPNEEIVLDAKADGIVVLTGGSSRISDALELLAAKRGQRLLISGVNPTTRQQEIARLMPEYKKIFDCCVDLDREALNTVGNAIETRRWAKDRGFKSLIVVTSNYHIPRAMAELSHQLPDVSLIAFPVVTHRLVEVPPNETTVRLFFLEYVKYMVALARMRLDPVT
jgi:uncharacterized SAM-binding protein YcdF (DUF218 family)